MYSGGIMSSFVTLVALSAVLVFLSTYGTSYVNGQTSTQNSSSVENETGNANSVLNTDLDPFKSKTDNLNDNPSQAGDGTSTNSNNDDNSIANDDSANDNNNDRDIANSNNDDNSIANDDSANDNSNNDDSSNSNNDEGEKDKSEDGDSTPDDIPFP